MAKGYVVICNVCKGNNIRTLINAAHAYGFGIIFVGTCSSQNQFIREKTNHLYFSDFVVRKINNYDGLCSC